MIQRKLENLLQSALADTPIVILLGARQTGKSTLVKRFGRVKGRSRRSMTLEDITVLSAARNNPQGFLADNAGGLLTLEEAQKAPELFAAMKLVVDTQRIPGKFLLTSSANVLNLPQISESLAGRVEHITLWPLSQSEIEETEGNLVDLLFSEEMVFLESTNPRADIINRMLQGGYPEVLGRMSEKRRSEWYVAYVSTLLKDIRDLAAIEGLTQMPRLFSLLAARAATLLNYSDLSVGAGISHTTLTRYISLLEVLYLIQIIPAWSTNFSSRLVKAPKLLFVDNGLIGHVLGINRSRFEVEPTFYDQCLQNFCGMELVKLLTWSETSANLFHFRTLKRVEVDFVLETADGRVAGIEINPSASLKASDFKGLQTLAEEAGNRFYRGVVLYHGENTIAFGDKLYAVPISTLWH